MNYQQPQPRLKMEIKTIKMDPAILDSQRRKKSNNFVTNR